MKWRIIFIFWIKKVEMIDEEGRRLQKMHWPNQGLSNLWLKPINSPFEWKIEIYCWKYGCMDEIDGEDGKDWNENILIKRFTKKTHSNDALQSITPSRAHLISLIKVGTLLVAPLGNVWFTVMNRVHQEKSRSSIVWFLIWPTKWSYVACTQNSIWWT